MGTQTQTKVSNSLSAGDITGQVITVFSGTTVTDQATLSGTNVAGAGGTVSYNIDSLDPSHWGWNSVASGGTVTVVNGVVPPSDSVTLDPGVYAWSASYSGDTSNASSKSERGSGIEIVLPAGSNCPTGAGWLSVRCLVDTHHDDHGNGGQNDNNGNGNDNGNSGGKSHGDGGQNDNNGNGNGNDNGNGNGGQNIHYRKTGGGWSGH